jgi:hypothetical protein
MVTPERRYTATDKRYCREYQRDAIIDGGRWQVQATVCRQPDGNRRMMTGAGEAVKSRRVLDQNASSSMRRPYSPSASAFLIMTGLLW